MKRALLLLAAVFLFLAPASGAPRRGGIDSRDIQVRTLDHPFKLSGQWLFTRVDDPNNKATVLDTSSWRMVRAPGPWKHAYPDGKDFEVGWYRGVLNFNPALVGQEVVILVDTYMGRMDVYLNGQEVYKRPENINIERYYSIQPALVRFKITQPREVLAIRVQTPLMTGIYELPFEMHRYDPHDWTLAWHQFRGGEARMIVAYVVLFFGLFFLLVYSKTRYSLYLVAALCSLVAFPFYAAPGDAMLRVFSPETMLYLHYMGLYSSFFAFLFSQYYYKFYPKLNWAFGSIFGLVGLGIGLMAVSPNLELFQHLREGYFLMILLCGLGATYNLIRAVLNGRTHARILLAGTALFLASGINDLLLALGKIDSFGMMFTGHAIFTGCVLYVSSATFANTFQENRQLVKELKQINDRLEELVAERTQQLRQKTNDISTMLQNMPQGILTLVDNGKVHPEYSAYLETIFETKDIAGRDMMDLVFSNTDLGPDTLAQVAAVPGVCLGEDRMNFEFNSHVMVKEFQKRMTDGRVKTIELLWSPICDEQDVIEKLMLCVRDTTEVKRLEAEASQQKRELEIIGQILSVSQEKFFEFIDASTKFMEENADVIRKTLAKHPEVIARLFRNMHTIKGNARTYGLLHLTNKVHETEQEYDDLRKNPEAEWNQELLLKHLEETSSLISEYARINDIKLGRKGPGRRGTVEKYLLVERSQIQQALDLLAKVDRGDEEAVRSTLQKVGRALNLIGTESPQDILGGILDSLPSLAKELGKRPPVITIEDHGIVFRSHISPLLKNLYMHLFRNALDHGLEAPESRMAQGKSPEGHIRLDISQSAGGPIVMRMQDDGRGLALARIRRVAEEKHLLQPGEPRAPQEIAGLIFVSGLSTAERISEISGRGVGLDAVKGFLEREGGTIEIRFLDDRDDADFRPFETIITLPDKFGARTEA